MIWVCPSYSEFYSIEHVVVVCLLQLKEVNLEKLEPSRCFQVFILKAYHVAKSLRLKPNKSSNPSWDGLNNCLAGCHYVTSHHVLH